MPSLDGAGLLNFAAHAAAQQCRECMPLLRANTAPRLQAPASAAVPRCAELTWRGCTLAGWAPPLGRPGGRLLAHCSHTWHNGARGRAKGLGFGLGLDNVCVREAACSQLLAPARCSLLPAAVARPSGATKVNRRAPLTRADQSTSAFLPPAGKISIDESRVCILPLLPGPVSLKLTLRPITQGMRDAVFRRSLDHADLPGKSSIHIT